MISNPHFLGNPRIHTQHLIGVTKWEKVSETQILGHHQMRVAHQKYADDGLKEGWTEMSSLSDLEIYASDLTAAIRTLSSQCQNLPSSNTQPLVPPDALSEAHRARQSILVTIAKLQSLLASPADFLHHLAVQNQLLACLQWLGEFQVLACIPLSGSVPIKDVADLAGVPEAHISRVIRMTATAGFLHEPRSGQVAHSALSAPFVTKPSYLDAVMFLASTVAPAALQMPTATQRFGASLRPNETAYNLAFNSPTTFASTCEQRPKLQRQWPAFLRYGTNDVDDRVTDLLSRLDHFRRGSISIVEVGARSIDRATTLANLYPSIHIVVQIAAPTAVSNGGWSPPMRPPTPCGKHDDLRQLNTSSNHTNNSAGSSTTPTNPNITIQQRTPTTPQPISDASVYILHLPSPSPTVPFGSLATRIIAELRAHLDVLRANPAATLILSPRLLPEPAAVNAEVEATARLRDLSLLQLANEREIDLAEWMNMLNSVSDSMGSRFSIALLCLSLGISPAISEDQTARVWAIFSYTVNGEAIPKVFPRSKVLTPYGAYQLHDAGSAFRERYVALSSGIREPSTKIRNLSPYLLDNDDIKVASTPDAAVLASAQAFTQGVYPPLDEAFNATFFNSDLELADGTVIDAPLGGYQYPSIVTFGTDDPQSVTVAGQALCPAHASARAQYASSKEFWQTYEDSAAFYNHLHAQALSGQFDTTEANYANATTISEFLDYQAVHNKSLLHNLSAEDVKRARWYAGKYVFATNGDTSASGAVVDGNIQTIAGQGLVSSVLNAFETSIKGQGTDGKMTLQFGSYETAVSFTSLLQLANTPDSNFSSLPNTGASFILELFSLESETYPTYPDPAQLYVRFILRNGTGTDFRPYPLFGYSPSNTDIRFSEFKDKMQSTSLGSTADWCRRCNSSAVFCSGVVGAEQSSGSTTHKKNSHGLSPAIAGVIGAAVAIGVLTLVAVVGFFACLRTKKERKPSLGGFKGNSKMASDSDLTFKPPQWGGDLKPPAASARAYERHGSWEMDDHRSPPQLAAHNVGSSSLVEDIEEEWQLHGVVEPVRVKEQI
ncbi:histidine phosphatase superfamily [Aspergillus varians]